jgi:hypothetical protein
MSVITIINLICRFPAERESAYFNESKEMMRKKTWLASLVVCFVAGVLASSARADIYPFEIFTDNGNHEDYDLDLYVEVTDGGLVDAVSLVDFTFYNDSELYSSIARIYFDDGIILEEMVDIINGPGTEFNPLAVPSNIPTASWLDPAFETTDGFSLISAPARPRNGVDHIGEWVTVTFSIAEGSTFEDVISQLNDSILRVGIHIIGLGPEDGSESAVTVPEPATVCLLGLGSLALIRRRRK